MKKDNTKSSAKSHNMVLLDKGFPFLDGHVIVFWLDRAGNFIRINQSLMDMSGYQENDLIGSSYALLKHPENPDTVSDDMHRKLKAGKRWKGLIKVLRKDGAYFWGLSTIMPIRYQSSQIRYLCTMRKASESQITSHKEKFYLTTKAG